MKKNKQRILLKISGQILTDPLTGRMSTTLLIGLIQQIKALSSTHLFALVIGGGNLFRGDKQGKELNVTPSIGHQMGMISTVMNGLLIKDIFVQHGLNTQHLCAFSCSEIAVSITQQVIDDALAQESIIIFSGGIGNPFFTTDTTAVLRALQIKADWVWKGTKVDGIYNSDPVELPTAILLKKITYHDALSYKVDIMDATAYALAQKHTIPIRVFNIFTPNALLNASQQENFGSTITEDI